MPDARVNINVGANVSEAVNGLKQVEERAKKLGDTGSKAGYALNTLSGVVRDLPFGFIAIQNNLPLVVDSFSNLAKESGGLGGALKGVGASLAGPLGVSFAFGAAISAVTALTQKYGSLSNAASALIGGNGELILKQKELDSAMEEAVKSISNEAAQIVELVALYPTFNEQKDKQAEIVKKLTDAQPKYFKGLDDEKDKIGALNTALGNYLKSLLGRLVLEAETEKIKQMITDSAEEMSKLAKKTVEATDAQRKKNNASKEAIEIDERLAKGRIGKSGDIAVGIKIVEKETIQDQVDKIMGNLKKGIQGEFENVDVLSKMFGLDVPGKGGAKDALEATRSRLSSLKDLLSEMQKNVSPNSNAFFDLSVQIAKVDSDLSKLGVTDKVVLDNMSKKLVEVLKQIEKARKETLTRSIEGVDGGGINGLISDMKRLNELQNGVGNPKAPAKIFAGVNAQTQAQIDNTKALRAEYGKLAETIAGDLGQAMGQFIDDLLSGQNAGESLFKGVINALKAMAIQFVTLVVEATILAALMKEFPALEGIFQGLGYAGKAVNAFSGLLNGKKHASGGIATEATWGMVGEAGPEAIVPLSQLGYLMQQVNPNVGGNWQSGGVQVSGVLVGRGNDLLAVVNQAGRSSGRTF